jgi:hypothetical protein
MITKWMYYYLLLSSKNNIWNIDCFFADSEEHNLYSLRMTWLLYQPVLVTYTAKAFLK